MTDLGNKSVIQTLLKNDILGIPKEVKNLGVCLGVRLLKSSKITVFWLILPHFCLFLSCTTSSDIFGNIWRCGKHHEDGFFYMPGHGCGGIWNIPESDPWGYDRAGLYLSGQEISGVFWSGGAFKIFKQEFRKNRLWDDALRGRAFLWKGLFF